MKKTLLFCLLGLNFFSIAQVPSYIPINGLQAWYPFNGNANDDSGAGHNGTVNGATLTTDRFGSANAAYMFGANNYISVSDNLNFRPTDFTISSWVTFTSTPSNYNLILAKNIGTGTIESIDINYAPLYNSWFCNISSTSSLGTYITSTENILLGTWYNIVYQFDDVNHTQKIFVNGVLTSANTVTTGIAYDSKPWTIGMEYENNIPSYFFNGKIDDIGMWDRLLTPQEIATVYQSNPVSVHENKDIIANLSVFPNPVTNQLFIDFISDSDKLTTIQIFDNLGKSISVQENETHIGQNKIVVNTQNLANGFYYLTISTAEKSMNVKFVKN